MLPEAGRAEVPLVVAASPAASLVVLVIVVTVGVLLLLLCVGHLDNFARPARLAPPTPPPDPTNHCWQTVAPQKLQQSCNSHFSLS